MNGCIGSDNANIHHVTNIIIYTWSYLQTRLYSIWCNQDVIWYMMTRSIFHRPMNNQKNPSLPCFSATLTSFPGQKISTMLSWLLCNRTPTVCNLDLGAWGSYPWSDRPLWLEMSKGTPLTGIWVSLRGQRISCPIFWYGGVRHWCAHDMKYQGRRRTRNVVS